MEAIVIGSKQALNALNNLIQLDFDAIAAYESAINRLKNTTYQNKLRDFQKDHHKHVQALSTVVRDLGGEPAEGADAKKILTQGKVVAANIVGDDLTILKAMKSNEDETNRKYEHAIAEFSAAKNVHALLTKHLEDEQRHRNWIVSTLQSAA